MIEVLFLIKSAAAFPLSIEEVERASKFYQMRAYEISLARTAKFNKYSGILTQTPNSFSEGKLFVDRLYWSWNSENGSWRESKDKDANIVSSINGFVGCVKLKTGNYSLCNIRLPETLSTEGSFGGKTFTHKLTFSKDWLSLPIGIDEKTFGPNTK